MESYLCFGPASGSIESGRESQLVMPSAQRPMAEAGRASSTSMMGMSETIG